ncbi:ComF family protein [Candidatus Gottesmanbacteria bacterium]|nr:ComF family protein [Candidatus Gottesmanbacteria bacterium]
MSPSILNLLLGLLFPRRCVSCGRLGNYFCQRCSSIIQIIKTPVCPVCERASIGGKTHPGCQTRYTLDGLTSIWVYEGPIKKAIKLLKYKFVTDLARELVYLSFGGSTSAEVEPLKETILTPVPLHWWRFHWRGFNQAEILGKMIAKKLGIKFVPDLLVREKSTRPQVELRGKQRQENIVDAFIINPRLSQFPISNFQFLIFDDVWTTGATLRVCRNVLKRAGAKKVWGLTLAR